MLREVWAFLTIGNIAMNGLQLSVLAICSKRESVLLHFRSADKYEDVSENTEVLFFLLESDTTIVKQLWKQQSEKSSIWFRSSSRAYYITPD
jgi:CRISPR/Cas system CMR-associated protein Cmr5 small subunit